MPGEETPGAEAKQKRQKGPEGQEDGVVDGVRENKRG